MELELGFYDGFQIAIKIEHYRPAYKLIKFVAGTILSVERKAIEINSIAMFPGFR